MMRMRAANFQFYVIPRSFIVHLPHPHSRAKLTWDTDKQKKNEVLLMNAKAKLISAHQKLKICQVKSTESELMKVWIACIKTSLTITKEGHELIEKSDPNQHYRKMIKDTKKHTQPPCKNEEECY